MSFMPAGTYGPGWGVPVGMAGGVLPGSASFFPCFPQVAPFFPGGREVGALAVGGAGVTERPGGSGSERSSALGGLVAAGGGATGSTLLSSTLPGVAVQGVSASTSGAAAVAGAADSGVSVARSSDPGSSSSQVSPIGARSSSRGFADACTFMEPGQEGIWEMLRLSVAATTWSHYNNGFRTVAAFLAARGWCPGDVSESLLADFVLSSFRAQLSRGVVRGRLAGFAFFCRALGWACPLSCFLVQRMLRAMHRVHPSLPDSRLPITHELLLRLIAALSVVTSSEYEAGLFQAAFVTSFFGALRVSELLVCPSSRFGFRGLRVAHVTFQESTVRLRIVSSKTDQLAVGHCVVLHAVPDSISCPVSCLRTYLAVRPEQGDILFVHANGSPLTRYQYQAVLRMALRFCGEDPSAYGTHSFRIGAATSASIAGMSGEGIQRLRRWVSDAFRGYIRHGGPGSKPGRGRVAR
uniref:Uncharacterized protein LOC117367477 isoform X1 n=1 Tax=Geotrypetes seraphini TaxID=260995 RepID=A0A6P8SLB8_GEOSA|nr:uncharacterized protein LOC117367477 isoform X1 [Geotrypetes seraphini]